MFLTIFIVASVTFLLPLISLVNRDYLPEFIIPIANQMRDYLPEAIVEFNTQNNQTKASVIVSEPIIAEPTGKEAVIPFFKGLLNGGSSDTPIQIQVKDLNVHVDNLFNVVEYFPESVHEFVKSNTYLVQAINWFNYYVNLSLDHVKQFEDSIFFNDYVYPKYQEHVLPIKEKTDLYLDEYYYPIAEEKREQFWISVGILLLVILLWTTLKKFYGYMVKDAKEFYDGAKNQYKPPKRSSQNSIAKDENEIDIAKKVTKDALTKTKNKNKKKSPKNRRKIDDGFSSDDNDDGDHSIYNKYISMEEFNEKMVLSFKKSAERIVSESIQFEEIDDELDRVESSIQSRAILAGSLDTREYTLPATAESDSEIAKSTFDSDENNSSMSSHDFEERDNLNGKTTKTAFNSFIQSSNHVIKTTTINEITSSSEELSQSTGENSTVVSEKLLGEETEGNDSKDSIHTPVRATKQPMLRDLIGDTSNGSSKIQLVNTSTPSMTLRRAASQSKLDGSPSKLVFRANFDTTSEVNDSNVYSSIIFSQSPNKALASPLRNTLGSVGSDLSGGSVE